MFTVKRVIIEGEKPKDCHKCGYVFRSTHMSGHLEPRQCMALPRIMEYRWCPPTGIRPDCPLEVDTIVPCIHYKHCMEHGTKCPKEKSEKYNCSDFTRGKEVEG